MDLCVKCKEYSKGCHETQKFQAKFYQIVELYISLEIWHKKGWFCHKTFFKSHFTVGKKQTFENDKIAFSTVLFSEEKGYAA